MSDQMNSKIMPAVFISHGSPMVAIQSGPYQNALADFGREWRPRAIVAISAHWGSGDSISITSDEHHTTLHDFGGFPSALYELSYNAPGWPELASRVADLLSAGGFHTEMTSDRGLDHGTWIPLRVMFPEVNIPVVAISVPLRFSPEELYRLGQTLAPLRSEGILVLGSGGVVHNLRLVHFADIHHPVDSWAAEFDAWFADAVEHSKLKEFFNFREAASHAKLAVPTFEHFAPVFVVLGAGSPGGDVTTIYEGFEHGNISMRSFAIA
jgi:4,5-DOPA dioxygenase extradiol